VRSTPFRISLWPLPLALSLFAASAAAKLPPLSDDAKAKAAEAAAKTAWGNKVANFQLCKSMDKVAARYVATMKAAGKDVKAGDAPACVDPGPYVAAAPVTATAAAPAAAPAVPAAAPTAAPAAPAKKS
jgi:hypothetical protein